MKNHKSILFFILRLVIALGILYYLAQYSENVFKNFLEINIYYLLTSVLLYGITLITTSYRWMLLLKTQDINLSFFDSFSLTMQGYFFSLVIPGGSIGGDIVRTTFLIKKIPSDKKVQGISSILIDRIVGMIALFSLSIISIILSLSLILNSTKNIKILVCFIAIISLIGLICGLSAFFIDYFRKINFINYIILKLTKKEDSFISKILDSVNIYKNNFKSIIFTIILSFIFCHLNTGLILYLLTQGVGLNISFPQALLAIIMGNIIALIPITPTGIGTRDWTITAILAIGLSLKAVTIIPMIFTAIMLAFFLSGSIFFLTQKTNKF